MPEPLRALIVEDSEDDALLLLRELRRAGFEPQSERVETAEALSAALATQDWDVIISDYSLPHLDGLSALRLTRATGRDVPFVIVSGTIGEDTAVEVMRSGAHDYVMKDRLARLGPAVTRELREAEGRRARRRAEEAYRTLVEHSLQGLVIVQDGRVAFANAALAEMLRYTVEELASLSPDPMRQITDLCQGGAHASREPRTRHQLRLRCKDGQIRWFEVLASPTDLGGRPAVQAVLADVTERLRREREERAIASVAVSLRVAERHGDLAALILEQIESLLAADAVALVMCDPARGDAFFDHARGLWSNLVADRIPADEGLSGQVLTTGRPYVANDAESASLVARPDWRASIRAIAGVPLMAGEETIGVLWMGRAAEIYEDDMLILTAIAEMAAAAMRRLGLHEELQRSHERLLAAYDHTLEGWARVLELRDSDTEGHTRRVTEMAIALGQALDCREGELEQLRRGALLHDIGKMAIPDDILRKPGPLSATEWKIMRRHPEHAREMLSRISYLQSAMDVPYCHHERWDGKGYPRRLKGDAIPLAARIFTVVDVWDALCSNRPYRPAWSRARVLRYVGSHAGRRFDPRVVEAFLAIVDPGTR